MHIPGTVTAGAIMAVVQLEAALAATSAALLPLISLTLDYG